MPTVKWVFGAGRASSSKIPLTIPGGDSLLAPPPRRGVPDVVEQVVGAAGRRREPIHRLLDKVRAGEVDPVGGLAGLEEGVGVLRGAAELRPVGGQRPVAVGGNGVFVD